jgi:putative acetyltransferase
MLLQSNVSPVRAEDYPRVLEVWEASVRATHHFVAASDIDIFRPMVQGALPHLELACMRDTDGIVVGFIAVTHGKIEMLFIHPDWRGHGVGKQLVNFALTTLGATKVDVNEQNEQALGFYLRMGFVVEGRSDLDGTGKPYPLLHMRLA